MKRISLLLLSVFFFLISYSQEYTKPLSGNPLLKNRTSNETLSEKKRLLKGTRSMLQLPFFENFISKGIYPSPELWTDNQVFVNNNLAENMPDIGIATFDAADAQGNIYSYAQYQTPFLADTLTSQPINLNYSSGENIYFSFFYQPGGLTKNFPESQDSLILEFFAPETQEWKEVWATPGFTAEEFRQVILPVKDDEFLKEGFRFRFKNYADLGSALHPSLATNCDFWHIDYIYLNKDRSPQDTFYYDLAFNKKMLSLLKDYQSVPWEHYKNNPDNVPLKDKWEVAYRNNGKQVRLIDSLNFSLVDLSGSAAEQFGYGGVQTVQPQASMKFIYQNHPFHFPVNDEDTADFLLTARMVTDTRDSAQNNVLKYTQIFRDYYAYDDGTAETSYGITGMGAKYGSVACRFSPLKPDYLDGVYIYFEESYKDAGQKYFWLNVWAEKDNKPDTATLYSMEGQLPEYKGFNQFVYYKFEEPLYVSEPFFLGWTQTDEACLNVGFDYNTDASKHVFYKLSDTWLPSQMKGSLMIRPVMGDKATGIAPEPTALNAMQIYPNPTKDYLFIKIDDDGSDYTLSVFDLYGRRVIFNPEFRDEKLDLQQLPTGYYILQISDNQGNMYAKKFVKN
ncbi:MAG: hypothetical protein CSB06_00285 [Bacteroidia bacterium]|nr:MAG: hypothetical protein CSB06_00285 [Bacteroidia bacterium]